MNKYFIFLVFSVVSLTVNAQWRNATPFNSELFDITFTDQYNGYATGQTGAIGNCSGYELSIYRTIDAGKNWIRIKSGTTEQIRAVHFVNNMVGWTVGASSEILKTIDGGATWNQVSYGVGSGYNDIWFRDANNGFVLGDNGMLRKSTNGGASWQTITSGVSSTLRKIRFVDNNVGFIACSDGQLLKTINGGSSWSVVNSGATWGVDVFFVSPTTGYHMGSDNGNTNLYKTTDGGSSWISLPIGYSYLRRLFFTSEEVGYIITWGFGILKTTDGGVTWNQTMTMNGINDNWSGIHFTDENTGYVSGKLGRVSKTTDGGVTWKSVLSGLSNDLSAVEAPHKDTTYFADINGKIFKTENGGVSLHQQTPDQGGDITKMHFFNTTSGLAAVGNGTVLKTVDGGENWNPQTTNTTRRLTDFSFINDQIGFASSFGGVVFKTTDAGVTWDSIPTGFDEYLTDIYFLNEDTGFTISSGMILRTFDGGTTWDIHDPIISGLMRDVKFYDNTVGYIVSSGKVLITKNFGGTWELQSSYSGTIHEMQLINDSTAFYTYSTSQRMSLDSGKTLYSQSTACLHNNWSMFDLAMTDGGDYGYTVGGINGLIHQTENTEIIASIVSETNSFCHASTVFVGFLGKGFFGAGNVFTAQLSDATGSFANPIDIGTVDLSAVLIYKSGIITATLPGGIVSGSGYRIRVVASNPNLISPDNGFDITIAAAQTPTLSLQGGAGFCGETNVNLSTTSFAGGLNPSYNWYINGSDIGLNSSNFNSDSLLEGDTIQVKMISSLACVNADSAISNTFIIDYSDSLRINLISDTTLCENDCVVLNPTVNNGVESISWSSSVGLNDSTILNPTVCGITNSTYSIAVTDTNSCMAYDSINVWVNPTPAVPIISFNSSVLSSTTSNYYQWFFNGDSILGANTINYTPLLSGDYSVQITDQFGCSAFSLDFNVIITGVNEYSKLVKSIHPNPFNITTTILFDEMLNGNYNLLVYDVVGKEVFKKSNLKGNRVVLNKGDLGSGLFLVYLFNNKNNQRLFVDKIVAE
ncbi:MAG: YCF48-related protein [Vicingaceae bacterium]